MAKASDEWTRQEDVDRAADELFAENGGHTAKIKGYQVAKKLEVSANTSIYDKLTDWKRRKVGQVRGPAQPVPEEMLFELRNALDQTKEQVLSVVTTQYQSYASELSDKSAQVIADMERKLVTEIEQYNDLKAFCAQVESGRNILQKRIDVLKRKLGRAEWREERLRAQVELLLRLVPNIPEELAASLTEDPADTFADADHDDYNDNDGPKAACTITFPDLTHLDLGEDESDEDDTSVKF